MNASNLAVCFAPSLFNSTRNPSQTPSPLRNRKNVGIPDPRELMEQKAAHECLTIMIQECKQLFTVSYNPLLSLIANFIFLSLIANFILLSLIANFILQGSFTALLHV